MNGPYEQAGDICFDIRQLSISLMQMNVESLNVAMRASHEMFWMLRNTETDNIARNHHLNGVLNRIRRPGIVLYLMLNIRHARNFIYSHARELSHQLDLGVLSV